MNLRRALKKLENKTGGIRESMPSTPEGRGRILGRGFLYRKLDGTKETKGGGPVREYRLL